MKPPHSCLCLLIHVFTTTVAVANPVLVEDLGRPPPGWIDLGAADGNQMIRLSITLESQGQETLEKTLDEISDPNHAFYGRHLSREEAAALLSPRRDAVDSVKRWLASEKVSESRIRNRGQFMDILVPVETAERLLKAQYRRFQQGSRQVVGTLAYSVPEEVRPLITAIQPTTFFEASASERMERRNLGPGIRSEHLSFARSVAQSGSCENNNTPYCLRKLYRMNNNYTQPDKRSLLGIAGFNQQAAQYDQLEQYIDKFAPFAKGSNLTVELVNNGTNPQGEYPSGEANLDVQIAVGMAHRVPVQFYSVGGEDHGFIPDLDLSDPTSEYIEPWLQLVGHLLDRPNCELPQVMSISYGVNEQVVPRAYANKICQLFGLLTLRGVSIVVASGDTGPGVSCQSNDGKRDTKFLPAFPATCPYVTSVGATVGMAPEKAMNFSSGGFSEYWTRPAWQESAVRRYLDEHGEKWKQYYARTGRGFPDVAAQGAGFPIFNHGQVEQGGGTSASAPLFASMIAVINDDRLKKGKPPLGFLNPWLYRIGDLAFTDITQGGSEGCIGKSFSGGPAPVVPGAGWDAVKGWDPVTGLGTPLFDQLAKLAMA